MMASTDMGENDYNYYPVKDSATFLLEVWKKGQQQLNSFWDIWRNDYLLNLREKSPMYHRNQKDRIDNIPQVGQVVIIKDEKVPRHTVDVERFTGLNIHSFSPMKFFAEILSWCIGQQCLLLTYLVMYS